MRTIIDYSQSSWQELMEASQHIDREKYPQQYAEVVEEIRQRGGPPPVPPADPEKWAGLIPMMVRFFSHGLGWFVIGLMAHIFLALVIAACIHTQTDVERSVSLQLKGWSIPLCSTFYGFWRAKYRPELWLSEPLVIMGALLVGTVAVVIDLGVIFCTAMGAMSGYC